MDSEKKKGIPKEKIKVFSPFVALSISLLGLIYHNDPEFIILSIFVGIIFLLIGLYIQRHSVRHGTIHNIISWLFIFPFFMNYSTILFFFLI